MIGVLNSQQASVADRIKLVEALLAEKLYGPALTEVKKCLDEKAISPAARAQLLILEAEAEVRTGKPIDAQKLLHEVLVLYPQHADQAKITLLTGWQNWPRPRLPRKAWRCCKSWPRIRCRRLRTSPLNMNWRFLRSVKRRRRPRSRRWRNGLPRIRSIRKR